MSAPWYLYVLECERGVLYIGITTNVEARFSKHAQGKGAAFTRMNRPLRILGAASFPDRSEATRAELALKKKSRGEKLRWVSENRLPSALRAATKREETSHGTDGGSDERDKDLSSVAVQAD